MPGCLGAVVLILSGVLLMVKLHDCLTIHNQHVHLAHFGDVDMYGFKFSSDMLLHPLRTISLTCANRGSLFVQVLICLAFTGDVCRVSIRKTVSPESGTEDGDSGKGSLLSTSALELSLPGLYHI